MAEAWLIAQDPYLKSEELGVRLWLWFIVWKLSSIAILQQTIDEVENLIKKHEAFEKAAAAQVERFAALERLTTVNLYNFSLISMG